MTSTTDREIAAAYSATGRRWRDGPAAVYDHLAEVLVARSPVDVRGASVVDVGAGTGAASAAARRAGAHSVVAVDASSGMLAVDADTRVPAAVADAVSMPFPDHTFDVAVAAFSLNHLADPARGLAEAARVVRPGGAVVASAYASDDWHPVKPAVEAALRARGWSAEGWYTVMQAERAPRLATEAVCREACDRARLPGRVERLRVPVPGLDVRGIVEWRLGMAQHARFVAALAPSDRDALLDDVVVSLGDCPPLVRSVMVITATV